jgi:hypothetical protein
MRSLLRPLLVLFAALTAVDPAAAVEQLDWCAPVVVRPEYRYWDYATCEPWWPDDEIARRADFVLGGFLRPESSSLAPETSICFGPNTMASSKAYAERLRARAATYGRSLHFIYLPRVDLVDRHTAASPGFDADFLLDAARGWRQSTDFFARDASPACACGCEWSEDPGPAFVGRPPGERMRDVVDAEGGPGTYQRKIQYTSPLGTGGTLPGAPRLFFSTASVADQTDAAYRAWRIQHLRDALEDGGFDAVELNQKFHQYLPNYPAPWWGSSAAPDVATYLVTDATQHSAPPIAYGYAHYVAGWAAFADDLEAAGIPYEVNVTPFLWRAGFTQYDDPLTFDVDEGAVIRDVAQRARWVMLPRFVQIPAAEYDAIAAQIENAGDATVIPYDGGCGNGAPPGRTPPALLAALALQPDAAQTATFAATALNVTVVGSATGPWDADFWCHCPAGSCGAPDATTTGQTGIQWFPPVGTCDAAYQAATSRRVARVEVRRAGFTTVATLAVTICAATCANGRDDDRDGAIDYPADAGCASDADPVETVAELACDDGVDNDRDTLTDHPADVQCASPAGTEGQRPSACGLGAELAVALGWILQRRRRTIPAARAR